MSGIFKRLVDMTRVQVNDILARYWQPTSASWEAPFEAADQTMADADATDAASGSEQTAGTGSPLPYSKELARSYDLLDLPFGAPMAQVTRRWKAYLKKSHPDLHAHDPAKQADATELTQQLNGAYKTIKQAWHHAPK